MKDFESKNSFLDRASLKANYQDFLFTLQPSVPVSDSLEIEFVDNLEKTEALVSSFNINLNKEGVEKLIDISCPLESPLTKAREYFEILSKLDSHLHSLFTLVVNMIFCGESTYAVGGTTSAAIGVIWCNPHKEWSDCDYLEYFLHELTHTLMFLDELRFSHYKNQKTMYEKENFCLSAILQANRPIDRVLHSIVVATEVLLLRSRNLVDHSTSQVHPASDQLIASTQASIDGLLSHPNKDIILNDRSLKIITMCQNVISQHLSVV